MKKILKCTAAVVLAAGILSGCAGKASTGNSIMYNYPKLSKYVTLAKYKGLTVDTSSSEFAKYFDDVVKNDMDKANLSETGALAAGDSVANGDTVFIDFVGKMNGEVFSGGSGEDYELTIGSGSMIEGFESGLIGAKLGETVTLNLNFPDPYPSNTELSGKPVSFDVTVKSGTRKIYPEVGEEQADALGYESLKAYNKYAKTKATQSYLYDTVTNASKIISYPQKEIDYYINSTLEYYNALCESYQMTFDDYLNYYKTTLEDFEASIAENIKPTIKAQLVCYSIARNEGISITEKEKEKYLNKLVSENNTTVENIKSQMPDGDIEFYTLLEPVTDFLVKSAVIK